MLNHSFCQKQAFFGSKDMNEGETFSQPVPLYSSLIDEASEDSGLEVAQFCRYIYIYRRFFLCVCVCVFPMTSVLGTAL